MSILIRAAVAAVVFGLAATAADAADLGYAHQVPVMAVVRIAADAADLGYAHHRHHRHLVPPPGYAYGGYGNGPGPGWVDAYGPGYAPGIAPGWGYVVVGAQPTILDLGY